MSMKRLGLLVLGLLVLGAGFLAWRGLRTSEEGTPAAGKSAAAADKTKVTVRSQNVAARGLGLSEAATLPILPDADRAGSLRLQGLVLDPQELPVAGATVLLDSNPVRTARTEKDGTFVFTGLSPRAYQLEALQGSLQAGPLSVWLSEQTEPVVIHLQPAASLEVDVVEASSKRAVPGAVVELRAQQPRSATADGTGRAVLQALPTGRQVLKVSAKGFSPAWQIVNVGQASPVPQRVTVALHTGSTVSGTVVDSRGAPVGGVTVTPSPSNTPQALTDARWDGVVADASGRWRFDSLEAGLYRFVASSPQRATGSSAAVTVDGERETSGVTITLPEPARLTGQVLDSRGDPVPHALVRVAVDEGLSRALARQATCDARGEFVMEGLPQRRVAVIALHEKASSTTQYVDLSQDAARQERVVLVLDATEVIRGRVEFSNGQPAGEAVVQAERSSLQTRNRVEQTLRGQLLTTADPSGNFELHGLLPGTYLLRAAPPGTPPQRRLAWLVPPVQAETGGREVVLRLYRGGTVQGQVRRDDNTIPESFSVVLRGAGGIPQSGGSDGRFVVQGVPEGSHTLYVTGQGFITKSVQNILVQEGQQTDLGVVVLQRGRQLQGLVTKANGTPVADATVSVSQALKGAGVVAGTAAELEYGLQQTRTGPDGSFTFAGLPIGPLQLGAEHPQEGRSDFTQIQPGVADLKMNLQLVATGELEGTVRSGGQPVSGVLVMVTNPGAPAGGTSGTTGTDGTFRFTNLTPGTYMVLAVTDASGGQQVQRTTATLQAQKVARVELEFPRGDVKIIVRAQPAEGARATAARVILLAKPQAGSPVRPAQVQPLTPVEPALFNAVAPGNYDLCVSAMESTTPTDGGVPTPPRSKCTPLSVPQQPAQQEISVAMPLL